MIVRESISFERGNDPRKSMGIGLEAYLKKKSLKFLSTEATVAVVSPKAASEIGSEFHYDIDTSKIYFIGEIEAGNVYEEEPWGIERVEEYIKKGNFISRRETNGGEVLVSYKTPYGKVVFSRNYGVPGPGKAWVDYETVKRLYFDKPLNESIRFERGIDPKSKMGLGEVTVELDYHNFKLDDDGNPDLEDEDTVAALEWLNDSGLKFKFQEETRTYGPVVVTLTGTREKMVPFVADYLDEPVEDIRDAMYKWDGKEEEDFWKLAGY
jgi:hypothetical protein